MMLLFDLQHAWTQGSDFKSKGDTFTSSSEARIRTQASRQTIIQQTKYLIANRFIFRIQEFERVRSSLRWASIQSPWRHCHDGMTPSLACLLFNSSPPGQNGRHFPGDILSCIFINEKFCILIKISLKFVPKAPIDNIPALIQIMAWCRSGDKPLSESMLTQFTICPALVGPWLEAKRLRNPLSSRLNVRYQTEWAI